MNMRSRSGALGDMSFMIRHGKLDLDALFDPDMLGDDLEAWLAESALMKRTFRNCAVISGLIARRFTGEEKSRRQVLFSTDLVYDVLRKHQADHVLLRAARADAATGLLDLKRLGDMLVAHPGANHPPGTRPRFAARGAGDAGNRPRVGLWRSSGRVAGGSRRRTRQRGDGIERDGRGAIFGRRSSRCALPRSCVAGRHVRSPISPARCSGRSSACSSSPTCIWKRAPASPRAACCCRPTTPWRRSAGSPP